MFNLMSSSFSAISAKAVISLGFANLPFSNFTPETAWKARRRPTAALERFASRCSSGNAFPMSTPLAASLAAIALAATSSRDFASLLNALPSTDPSNSASLPIAFTSVVIFRSTFVSPSMASTKSRTCSARGDRSITLPSLSLPIPVSTLFSLLRSIVAIFLRAVA